MKIQQENLPYRPITIKLEKHSEAVALFGLIDKIDSFINNEGAELPYDGFTREEKDIIIKLSDARTRQAVSI